MGLLAHKVTLEPESHRYYDVDGREYTSVSKIIGMLHEPFDAERVSWFSARKQLRVEMNPKVTDGKSWKVQPTDAQIELRQKALQMQWKQRNTDSITIGTFIHNSIETALLTGFLPEGNADLAEAIAEIIETQLSGYQEFHSEEVLYSNRYLIAGTADFLGRRVGGDNPVIDISDFKTNASKGILFNSEYGKWLLPPVAHLEDCSYIHYAIQLSLYALMMQEHGFRPGRLKLIYIPPSEPKKYFPIAIPFLKFEVEAILEYLASQGKISLNETTAWV